MTATAQSRREFLKRSAVYGGILIVPGRVLGKDGAKSPNAKLNVAAIGAGGKGRSDIDGCSGENIVALCDVDHLRAADAFKKHPGAEKFQDYRKMLDKLGNRIDAVIVATPDHTHFQAAHAAVQLGKGVYVQKPLCHTLQQVRTLTLAARQQKVATQMGNQGHSSESTRLAREWIRAGVIGDVREVRAWTNRPIWPQGMAAYPAGEPVPASLDWKLWQGGVTDLPYNKAYAPFAWRGWYAFGCGALGDMACHIMDAAFFALDLGAPTSVQAETWGESKVAYPKSSIVTYQFPARGKLPPVVFKWHDGEKRCERPAELEPERKIGNDSGGSLIIGDKATIMVDSHSGFCRIIPEARMKDMQSSLPPKTLPRVQGGHYGDWLNACKGGTPASSNFDYAGPFTEVVLLGALAQRLPGVKLLWNAEKLEFQGNPAATALVKDPVPKG